MQGNKMVNIKEANKLFQAAEYERALEYYYLLAKENETWEKTLAFNIECCKKKLGIECKDTIDRLIESRTSEGNSGSRKKVLISDFRYPRYDSSAGELATFGIIKGFVVLGYNVTFVPKESTDLDLPYIKALRKIGVTCIENVCYDNFKDKVIEASKDLHIAYIFRPDVARLCIPAIRAVSVDTYIFYHAPDVYFRREKAQYDIERAEGAINGINATRIDQIVLDEVYAAASADHVVCVSEGDAIALKAAMKDPNLNKSDLPLPEISTFPILYLERKAALPEFPTTSNICFVGSSEHTPNRDAIRWFLENVWEQLSAKNPELYFHVIGKTNATEKTYYEQFNNVVVVGWVDSVEETLPKYKLTVAPLRFGAGIKGKVGTSLIVGVPCVASKVAIEDMGLIPDEEIIRAESVDDYVNRITRILKNENEWMQLSRKGAIKAEQLYSHEATFKRFIRILNDNDVLDAEHYLKFIKRVSSIGSVISFPEVIDESIVDVSIVVPGYNNVDLTRMCLASIYYSILPSDNTRFEVIYADDCSGSNVIPELASQFENILVTETGGNSGFVVNTNTGASVAKGKYLVLLNNDAVVMPSWLDGLLQVIQSTDSCHVAGSKLLYADQKIQEAGAGIWTDGRSCSFGRGPDGTGLVSTRQEYNFVCEVDYVSFASVIIRKRIWDSLGGLSSEYGFGYCDDSDFCMRVRECGGLVLYAPASEVIHNESASFSKRNCKAVAAEKKRNGVIFRRKWANQLIGQHPAYDFPSWDSGYGESISKAHAARHNVLTAHGDTNKGQRHILYFSPFPSHPASHGNQTTIQKFGQFLQGKGYAVHFVLLQSHMYGARDADDMAAAWDSFDIIKLAHFPSCNGQSIRYDSWYVPGIGEQIALLCAKYQVDTIICSYIFQSRLLDYIPNYILKIIDTHDKFTDRYSILDKLGKPREFFSCTGQEEGMYLSRADIVLARRDEETEYFNSISTAKVYTVPHIEDRSYLDKGLNKLSKVGMVASCNHINLDIVVAFVDELIRQQSANWDFRVLIAGEVKSLLDPNDPQQARVASHPAVSFIGYVDDIHGFYESVDMIVCPIMSGTGINVKTVQALAYGMPILATRHASKGVPTAFDLHQFIDVPSLARYLLSNRFEADRLAEMASISRRIFDDYIDWGCNNFIQALALDQPGLRNGIGKHTQTSLRGLFSRKSEVVCNAGQRKKYLSRDYQVKSILYSLDEFGPSWINLNTPLPNKQADGSVGYWFRFNKPLSSTITFSLHVGGRKYPLHISSGNKLLTTSIQGDAFNRPGRLLLELEIQFDWESPSMFPNLYQLAEVDLVCT